MKIHLVGISGTGMGSLATLFREAGHTVTGSDVAFDPPTGPMLRAAGIACKTGYSADNLGDGDETPNLVVVGNAIGKSNVEAIAVETRALPRTSMSAALREHFLAKRTPLVVAGTHGKTTTSAMAALVLEKAGLEPGWFIGGQPRSLPSSAAVGRTKRKLTATPDLLEGHDGTAPAPFVVEGDEYDAVYWHKAPKFLDYIGVGESDVAILTSVEHDHIDIYPSADAYEAAFVTFIKAIPAGGLLVCDAHDARARALASAHATCRVSFYALEGDDTGDVTPTWVGAPSTIDEGGQQFFDVYTGGMSCGRFAMRAPGKHNVRNALAAMAAAAEGFGVPVSTTKRALAQFEGVKRRQELLGAPNGVRVYDDFAHHPTAVDETLHALRAKHPAGKLIAIFEPRSATACRALHQDAYVKSFDAADRVLLAPVGRSGIADSEKLDVPRLARDLGTKAVAAADGADILARVVAEAAPGDTVAVLSNGAFGGLHEKLLAALAVRAPLPNRSTS